MNAGIALLNTGANRKPIAPMRIHGIETWSAEDLEAAVQQGGRFVVFEYCVSLLLVTLRRSSDIYFLPANDLGLVRGLPWTLVSLCLGWWGVPWGLIQTPGALLTNLTGGRDVTTEVCALLAESSQGE